MQEHDLQSPPEMLSMVSSSVHDRTRPRNRIRQRSLSDESTFCIHRRLCRTHCCDGLSTHSVSQRYPPAPRTLVQDQSSQVRHRVRHRSLVIEWSVPWVSVVEPRGVCVEPRFIASSLGEGKVDTGSTPSTELAAAPPGIIARLIAPIPVPHTPGNTRRPAPPPRRRPAPRPDPNAP